MGERCRLLEWASAYPKMVERMIPVVGAGETDAVLTGWLDVWTEPIRLDPNCKGGSCYDAEPVDGLVKPILSALRPGLR